MANYYISYRIEWKSINDNINRLDILDSELLSDDIKPLKGGATPLLHEYTTDDPFAPVKGSSILVQYANEYDETPLIDFYTENDPRFKAIWYQNGVIRFIGFLVQDDCNEKLSSHSKINTLSFTDNLGLLKNVGYDQAVTTDPYEFINYKDLICKMLAQTGLEIDVQIFSSLALDGSSATVVSEWGVFGSSFANSDGGYKDCYAVLEDALKAIRATCVQSNGVWKVVRWAEGIYSSNDIAGAAYKIDGTSIGAVSLDSVVPIESIQVDGISEIIRPLKSVTKQFDYKYLSKAIRNSDLRKVGTFDSGPASVTIDGITYDQNTYNLPTDNGWFNNYIPGLGVNPKIVIQTIQSSGVEAEKFIRIENLSGTFPTQGFPNLEFNSIYVNKGDVLNLSFEFRNNTKTSANQVTFALLVVTAAGVCYPFVWQYGSGATKVGVKWGNTINFPTNFDDGNANQKTDRINRFFDYIAFNNAANTYPNYSTFDINSIQGIAEYDKIEIPATGKLILRFYVDDIFITDNQNPYLEVKNLQLKLEGKVSETKTIKVQIQAQSNSLVAKNEQFENITIDDAPTVSIIGALFKNAGTFILPLTTVWKRNYGFTTEKRKLSEITAFEDLFNRRKPRTKVDATLLNADEVDYTTVVKLNRFPNKNFIFGQYSYNARLDSIDATLYENYEDGEEDADLNNTYTFNFLYE